MGLKENANNIFSQITRVNDGGKTVGIKVNDKPEYKDEIKVLRREFNNFTKDICPENWGLYKRDEYKTSIQ